MEAWAGQSRHASPGGTRSLGRVGTNSSRVLRKRCQFCESLEVPIIRGSDQNFGGDDRDKNLDALNGRHVIMGAYRAATPAPQGQKHVHLPLPRAPHGPAPPPGPAALRRPAAPPRSSPMCEGGRAHLAARRRSAAAGEPASGNTCTWPAECQSRDTQGMPLPCAAVHQSIVFCTPPYGCSLW